MVTLACGYSIFLPSSINCNHTCYLGMRPDEHMNKKKITMILTVILIPIIFSTSAASGADNSSSSDVQTAAPTSISIQYEPVIQKATTLGITSLANAVSPCTLTLQNIYLRQSFGYGGVGTKVTTSCSVKVTSIAHTTYIQKMGFFGWNTQGTFPASNSNSSSLSQLDIGVTCTNGISTTWTGFTNGYVVYNGVQYTASASVANGYGIFNCGT